MLVENVKRTCNLLRQQATGVGGLLSRTEGIYQSKLRVAIQRSFTRSFGLSYKMSPRNKPESK